MTLYVLSKQCLLSYSPSCPWVPDTSKWEEVREDEAMCLVQGDKKGRVRGEANANNGVWYPPAQIWAVHKGCSHSVAFAVLHSANHHRCGVSQKL